MMPYDTYRLYEVERAKSPCEIQRADGQVALLAAAICSLFRAIAKAPSGRGQAVPGRPAPRHILPNTGHFPCHDERRHGGFVRPADPCAGSAASTKRSVSSSKKRTSSAVTDLAPATHR